MRCSHLVVLRISQLIDLLCSCIGGKGGLYPLYAINICFVAWCVNMRGLLPSMSGETGYRALAVLLALVPFGLVFGRAISDSALSLIAFSFLVALALRQVRWPGGAFLACALGLWGWMLLVVTPASVGGWQESFKTSLVWLRYPFWMAALLWWVERRPRTLQPMLWTVIALLAVLVIDTLVQRITGVSLSGHPASHGGRLTGPLSHPSVGIVLYSFVLVAGLLLVAFTPAAISASRPARWGLAGLAVAAIMMVMMTGERAVTVMMLASLGVGAGLLGLRQPQLRRPAIAAALLAVLVLVIVVWQVPYIQTRAQAFINQLSHFLDSAYGKLYIAALELWASHPFTGIGTDHFRLVCAQLSSDALMERCRINLHPHNYYLELLAETGPIGLAVLLVMVWLSACEAWRAVRQEEMRAQLVGVLALMWLVFSLFPFAPSQSFFSNWRAALLWWGWALMWLALRAVRRPDVTPAGSDVAIVAAAG